MPGRQDAHVLTVDANLIHMVDTENPVNLYSMWTVFSRCADAVEQGRRLENLSWRLWQKKQLADSDDRPTPSSTTILHSAPRPVPSDAKLPEVPQLSGSVDSLADEETVDELTSVSAPLEIARPRIHRQDSSTSRRDRHISSDDIEKMIVSIVKDKGPLSAPSQSKTNAAAPRKKTLEPPAEPTIYRSGSTTTESQSSKISDLPSELSEQSSDLQPRTQVVRGFSPQAHISQSLSVPSIRRPSSSTIEDAAPTDSTASPAPKTIRNAKQPAAFALGGSYSSSELGQSVEARQPGPSTAPKALKSAMFKLGGSSEEEGSSLKSALVSSKDSTGLSAPKKQASFSTHLVTHAVEPDSAIDSDSEADYIDESAIDDDDDSSEWEDSVEDSGKSSVDEKYFQRVDSKANLTSRRSLITLMLAQSDERAKKLSNHASQSTSAIARGQTTASGSALGASPNDSDDAPLMMKGTRQPGLKPIREAPRTGAQSIAMPTTHHAFGQAALSPRTTRRNMLATELTESLRRHLLWERSQKSSTANAVLKRRHTSHDVANLKQYPERPCMKKTEDANAGNMNQFFSKESYEGYHAKGW